MSAPEGAHGIGVLYFYINTLRKGLGLKAALFIAASPRPRRPAERRREGSGKRRRARRKISPEFASGSRWRQKRRWRRRRGRPPESPILRPTIAPCRVR